VDPLTLAVRFQREFARLASHLLKTFGRLPSEVGEQTPHQLYDVAFGTAAKETAPPEPADPVKVLADLNRKRAEQGLQPVGQLFGKVLKHVPDA